MRPHISDKKWACIAAICFLGMAAFVIFVIKPGGFEGQGAWYYLLFPGALPASVLSDLTYERVPTLYPAIYWSLVISFTFAWYWGISYATIRSFHARGWRLGSPEF